jgi:hypothetical protein
VATAIASKKDTFTTYEAPLPKQQLIMELGGPAQTIEAAALVAAGTGIIF